MGVSTRPLPLQVTIADNDIHTFILNTSHIPQTIVVEQLKIIILKETPIANTGAACCAMPAKAGTAAAAAAGGRLGAMAAAQPASAGGAR